MNERGGIEKREGALTHARLVELQEAPVDGKFDAAHLREIHRRIFQDLPEYNPGEYRADAPAHIKARALEQSGYRYHVHYAARNQVDIGLEKTLAEFGGPHALHGLNAEQFSARMAKLYADLDYLHPFTEGNSRTLRAFTTQLARQAGYELGWGTTSADAASRDRLYVARDKEVLQRAYPGLNQERAMNTDSRAEYEAYVRVLAPFAKAETLQTVIKESTYQRKDLLAAKAFREDSKEDALEKHPDLAGSFVKLKKIENDAAARGLSEREHQFVTARARENIANAIERGHRPALDQTLDAGPEL